MMHKATTTILITIGDLIFGRSGVLLLPLMTIAISGGGGGAAVAAATGIPAPHFYSSSFATRAAASSTTTTLWNETTQQDQQQQLHNNNNNNNNISSYGLRELPPHEEEAETASSTCCSTFPDTLPTVVRESARTDTITTCSSRADDEVECPTRLSCSPPTVSIATSRVLSPPKPHSTNPQSYYENALDPADQVQQQLRPPLPPPPSPNTPSPLQQQQHINNGTDENSTTTQAQLVHYLSLLEQRLSHIEEQQNQRMLSPPFSSDSSSYYCPSTVTITTTKHKPSLFLLFIKGNPLISITFQGLYLFIVTAVPVIVLGTLLGLSMVLFMDVLGFLWERVPQHPFIETVLHKISIAAMIVSRFLVEFSNAAAAERNRPDSSSSSLLYGSGSVKPKF